MIIHRLNFDELKFQMNVYATKNFIAPNKSLAAGIGIAKRTFIFGNFFN